MDGSGQNLERRFRLIIWSETTSWVENRCFDLSNLNQVDDAMSLHREFHLNDFK